MSKDYLYLTGIIKSAQDVTGYPGIRKFAGEDSKGYYFYSPRLNALDGFRERLFVAEPEETYDYIVNATNGLRVRSDWLESLEYEVDWTMVPLDEVIEVSTGDGNWYPMSFFKYDPDAPNNPYFTFRAGRNSKTALDLNETVEVNLSDWENLGGKYFFIYSPDKTFYIWFNLDENNVDPGDPGGPLGTYSYTGLEISIETGEPANSIATKVKDAIDSRSEFNASVSSNKVTIQVVESKAVYDASSGTTSLTINVTTQGGDVQSWPMARPILP